MPHKRTLVSLMVANVALAMFLVMAPPLLPTSSHAQAPSEPSLLDAALRDVRSPDRLRRLAAVRVLGALADPSARTVLQELRTDPDAAIALEAAAALARLVRRPRAALEPVVSGLDA